MRRHPGRTVTLILVGLVGLALAWLRSGYAGKEFCDATVAYLPRLLGANLSIGRCRVDPFRVGLELDQVAFSKGEGISGEADRLFVQVSLLGFLRNKLHVERLELEGARLAIDLTQPGESSPSGSKTCALDDLKRLEVDRLTLTDASVQLVLPGSRTLNLDHVEVDLSGSRSSYRSQLSVGSGMLSTGSFDLPISRFRSQGLLLASQRRLLLSNTEVTAGDFAFSVRGELSRLCDEDPQIALELKATTPLDLLPLVFGRTALPDLSGRVATEATVTGSFSQPRIATELSFSAVRVQDLQIGDGFASLQWSPPKGDLTVQELALRVGKGNLHFKGRVAMTGNLETDGELELQNVSFGQLTSQVRLLSHPWVDFQASGHVAVSGTLSPFQLEGPASLGIQEFRLTEGGFDQGPARRLLEFDRATVETQLDIDATRVHLGQAKIKTPWSSVDADATLHFREAQGLRVEADFTPIVLKDLGHLMGITWSGTLQGKALIAGPYSDIGIGGSVTARDFTFDRLKAESVKSDVDFRHNKLEFSNMVIEQGRTRIVAGGGLEFHSGQSPGCHGKGTIEWGRVSDLVTMVGETNWIFNLVRDRMEARVSGDAEVEGTIAAPNSRITLALADATYYERKLGAGRLLFRSADGKQILIDDLSFHGPVGDLAMSGHVDLGAGIDFHITGHDIRASQLALPDAAFLEAQGTMSLDARLSGPSEAVRLTGTLGAHDLSVFNTPLGSGDLALAYDQGWFSVTGPIGDAIKLFARVRTDGMNPFQAKVDLATRSLNQFIRKEGVHGELDGELTVEGNLEHWRDARGLLWLSKLTLGKNAYEMTSEGPVEASFDGPVVTLRKTTLDGPSGTRLSLGGTKGAGGKLALALEGSFDLRLAEMFFDWLDQAAGKVEVAGMITGTLDEPALVGSADLKDGRLHIVSLPFANMTRNLSAHAEFSHNLAYLSDVTGETNNGRIEGRGEIALKQLVPDTYDLDLGFEEVAVKLPGELPGIFSGQLRFHGPADLFTMSGDIDVVRLRYAQEIDPESALRQLNARHLRPPAAEKQPPMVKYDATIHVNGDARVENSLINAPLTGELRMVGDNVHWGLLGTIEVPEGSGRAFFRGNELALSRVALTFNNREKLGGLIEAMADSQVRDYRLHVHVRGSFDDPQVDLSSDPALARADIVTLLTLGVTSKEAGTSSAYSVGTGTSVVGELLFDMSGLGKKMKSVLPKNPLIRDLSVNLGTQYSSASGQVEPTAQFEAKVLSDAFRMRLQQPILTGRGRKAQFEYRFSDKVSTQAQWDSESDYRSWGDLGVDLKMRWELE